MSAGKLLTRENFKLLFDLALIRQRFIDICNGKSDAPVFTVMKDKSLAEKKRKGEFLINKVLNTEYM